MASGVVVSGVTYPARVSTIVDGSGAVDRDISQNVVFHIRVTIHSILTLPDVIRRAGLQAGGETYRMGEVGTVDGMLRGARVPMVA